MTNAVAVHNTETINDTLRALGLINALESGATARAKINGSTFELADDVFPSNQKTKAPAFHAVLLDTPQEYHGFWFTQAEAELPVIGRPNAGDSFCKSYYAIPSQAGKFAEDGTDCNTCPVRPFIKKGTSPLGDGSKKCSWRADLDFVRTDELGQKLDDTVFTLSLSTTSVIEFKGMRGNASGVISDLNFVQRLMRFAITAWPEMTDQEAMMRAGLALKLGGVVVGVRLATAKSDDGSRSWPVVVLDPVNIIDVEVPVDAPASVALALAPKVISDDASGKFDDLPF